MTADNDSTRACTHCKTVFPATLDYFPPHKIGKYGLHSWCRTCKKEIDAARRNRPDQQARQQAWRDANKDKVKKTNQKYRADGYKSTAHVSAWVAANPERARELIARTVATRRTKIWYVLKSRVSARIRSNLAFSGGKARRAAASILGYSMEELSRHIERQFTKGMTWDALMAGEIHIDHIIPVALLKPIEIDSEEFRACWALSNLRPMWAADNRSKGDRVTTLL